MGSALGSAKTAAKRLGMTRDRYLEQVSAGLKWCRSCTSWVERSAFGSDASRADGLSPICAGCRVTAIGRPGARARRQRASQGLAWCRGCREWLPVGEVRSGVCRPHANEEYRRAYSADGAAIRARVHARRRSLAVVPPWWWEEKLVDWEGRCAYGCGREGEQRDHVWPVARGGQSRPGNVVPACPACNARKRDAHPEPWVDRGFLALPAQWTDLAALAMEHGTDEWLEQLTGLVHDGYPA